MDIKSGHSILTLLGGLPLENRLKVEGTVRKRVWSSITGLLVVLLLATSCTTAELEAEMSALRTDVDKLSEELRSVQTDQQTLAGRVDQLKDELGQLQVPADLSRAVSSLRDDVAGVDQQVSDIFWEIDDLKSCVNDYMDTIADWSSNIYSYYEYYYC